MSWWRWVSGRLPLCRVLRAQSGGSVSLPLLTVGRQVALKIRRPPKKPASQVARPMDRRAQSTLAVPRQLRPALMWSWKARRCLQKLDALNLLEPCSKLHGCLEAFSILPGATWSMPAMLMDRANLDLMYGPVPLRCGGSVGQGCGHSHLGGERSTGSWRLRLYVFKE